MTEISKFLDSAGISYSENEPMSLHTTFKIGGPARLAVFPKSEEEISAVIKKCNQCGVRFITVGNGSNLLVADEGIDAVVIILGKDFAEVTLIGDDVIYAKAGASLMKVCRFALENSLSGLEFAYGIPGSCGGGAFMNAGAYGGELKDVMFKCEHIDANGNVGSLEGDKLELSYRHSAYFDNGGMITGVYFKLKKADANEIKAAMDDYMSRRRDKQPLEYPSAGSTFKRPEGHFAGALIEQCNLKGTSVGGAKISTKHAGFVINTGNATCNDVLQLCKRVADTVKEQTGVDLEMEVRVTK